MIPSRACLSPFLGWGWLFGLCLLPGFMVSTFPQTKSYFYIWLVLCGRLRCPHKTNQVRKTYSCALLTVLAPIAVS